MNIRKLSTVAVAATLLLGVSGCTFMNPIASRIQYAPSDGAQVDFKAVDAHNFIYISDGKGHGGLIGSLVNKGAGAASVKLQYKDAATSEKKDLLYTLLPNQKLDFGYNGGAALNVNLGGKPGQTVTVFVVPDNETGKSMNVPVLDGTLPEYSEIYKQLGGTAPAVTPTATVAPTK